MIKHPKLSAESVIYCVLLPWNELKFGGFYEEFGLCKVSKFSNDKDNVQKLWDTTISFLEAEIELLNISKTYKLIAHKMVNSNSCIRIKGEKSSKKNSKEDEFFKDSKSNNSFGSGSRNEAYYNCDKLKNNIYGVILSQPDAIKSYPELPNKSFVEEKKDSKKNLNDSKINLLKTSDDTKIKISSNAESNLPETNLSKKNIQDN